MTHENSIFDADDVVITLSDGETEIVATAKEITIDHDFVGERHITEIEVAIEGKFQE